MNTRLSRRNLFRGLAAAVGAGIAAHLPTMPVAAEEIAPVGGGAAMSVFASLKAQRWLELRHFVDNGQVRLTVENGWFKMHPYPFPISRHDRSKKIWDADADDAISRQYFTAMDTARDDVRTVTYAREGGRITLRPLPIEMQWQGILEVVDLWRTDGKGGWLTHTFVLDHAPGWWYVPDIGMFRVGLQGDIILDGPLDFRPPSRLERFPVAHLRLDTTFRMGETEYRTMRYTLWSDGTLLRTAGTVETVLAGRRAFTPSQSEQLSSLLRLATEGERHWRGDAANRASRL